MDIVNIYGQLNDKSKIVIGVGNYNNIHGLACYFPDNDLLQIHSLPEVQTANVLELTLNHEKVVNDKLYFSLSFGSKYIGVVLEGDCATTVVSSQKTLFTIDYSIIDSKPRPKLLAGSLYCLSTNINGKDYIVSWKINGFTNGDLIIFLPTLWYESNNGGLCVLKQGVPNLLHVLNQLHFKGFTTEKWCEEVKDVSNCEDGTYCGNCMGQCRNSNEICHPNGGNFVCGSGTEMGITMAEPAPMPTGMGTTATWIGVCIVILLVIFLAWTFMQ